MVTDRGVYGISAFLNFPQFLTLPPMLRFLISILNKALLYILKVNKNHSLIPPPVNAPKFICSAMIPCQYFYKQKIKKYLGYSYVS